MSTINGSRLKILAMLFLFVPQESWDLQLRMFGYITCGFPRIFGYVLQVIKYSISVPLDRGGFGGWNLMLTPLESDLKKNFCETPLLTNLNMDAQKESRLVGTVVHPNDESNGGQRGTGMEPPPPYTQVPQYREENPQVIQNPTIQQQWPTQPGSNFAGSAQQGQQQPSYSQQPGAFHLYNTGYPRQYYPGPNVVSGEVNHRRQQEITIQQGIANTVVISRRYPRRSCAYRLTRLGVSLFLVGLVLLIVLGVLIVHPTMNDMKLKKAVCTVTSSKMTGEDKSCSCGRYCSSSYPCLEIRVGYHASGEEHIAYLYENVYDSKNKCSTQPCNTYGNVESVSSFKNKFGQVRDTYTCFYNQKKLDEVFLTRSSVKSDKMKILHCILWPMLIIATSVGLLGTLFCRSKGHCCFKKTNGSSVPYQGLQPTT